MKLFTDDELKIASRICEIGKRLWVRNLISAFDGNISVRLDRQAIMCTRTGVSKGFLEEADLVIVDPDGMVSKGECRPSSEIFMHLGIYRARSDVSAVVHAHPPHATAYAISETTIPQNVLVEVDQLLGAIPVLDYVTPGTKDLEVQFENFFANYGDKEKLPNAFLLRNHGATTMGQTLEEAWHRMEALDHCCNILLNAAKLGGYRTYKN